MIRQGPVAGLGKAKLITGLINKIIIDILRPETNQPEFVMST